MIEASRRHGHFDRRWSTNGSKLASPPVPGAGEGGPSVQSWENEGGRYLTTGDIDVPAGLEWYAFCNRYFPGRGRHDLEALTAYGAYRSAATTPNSVAQ